MSRNQSGGRTRVDGQDSRRERLRHALRANIARRKASAALRGGDDAATSGTTDGSMAKASPPAPPLEE